MGEEPISLRKYFCDSNCQNSICIMHLRQVSLKTRKFKEQQFTKHTHTFAVYLYKHTQHFSCCGHSSFSISLYMADVESARVSSGKPLECSQPWNRHYGIFAIPLGRSSEGRKSHFIWALKTCAIKLNFSSVSLVKGSKINRSRVTKTQRRFGDPTTKQQKKKHYICTKTSSQIFRSVQRIAATLLYASLFEICSSFLVACTATVFKDLVLKQIV